MILGAAEEIAIAGVVEARGGDGGDGITGQINYLPGGGGGGSAIHLWAPTLEVSGGLRVDGGGTSAFSHPQLFVWFWSRGSGGAGSVGDGGPPERVPWIGPHLRRRDRRRARRGLPEPQRPRQRPLLLTRRRPAPGTAAPPSPCYPRSPRRWCVSPETRRHGGAVRATLTGTLEALAGTDPSRTLPPGLRLDDLTVLVTGASRGLGRAIATGLATHGAHLVLPCRSLAAETATALAPLTPHGDVTTPPVDLAALATVDALVDDLAARGVRLDRVVLDAGVVPAGARTTADGLDLMLQVNFLANVRLLDRLRATGVLPDRDRRGARPRVVIVGSEAHRSAPALEPGALGSPWRYGTAEVLRYYGLSKLHLHTWAATLARREPALEVHHLCPGAVATEIAREAPGWVRPLLDRVMRWTFQAPGTAAGPVLWLCASPDVAGRTGVYLHLGREKTASPAATDPAAGDALWDAAHTLLARLRGAP